MTESTGEPVLLPSGPIRWLGLGVGFLLSVLIGGALVIATAKAGISPGVSPLVVLLGWVTFGAMLGPRLKGFLALAQVTGSGGAAVSAGVIFTAPILQIYFDDSPDVDLVQLILASVSGSLLGWGFVGLATQRFLTDPRLPAPEAVACDRLINTAADRPNERPPVFPSLIAGFILGAIAKGVVFLQYLKEEVVSLNLPLLRRAGEVGAQDGLHIGLPLSPLYVGIGALLTLPTALLIFAGGLVNAVTVNVGQVAEISGQPFRWVGGAAMTVAVIFSLIRYMLDGRAQKLARIAADAPEPGEQLLEIPPGRKRLLLASIVVGIGMMLAMMVRSSESIVPVITVGVVAVILVSFLSGLGGLLSLQVGSSASPVSGTVFVSMLVLSGMALLHFDERAGVTFLVPILVAVCVAICAANDSSQDYKTLQLNGYRVSDGFTGQLVGLLGGAIAVPFALAVAHGPNAALGTEELPCPQASFFAGVLELLFGGGDLFTEERLKPLWYPIFAGLALGVVAIVIETIGRKRGVVLSSLAFAVGIYLPSAIGIGILLGAIARFAGTRSVAGSTHRGILSAAGLISGYALFSLAVGVLIVVGFEVNKKQGAGTAFGQPLLQAESWDDLLEPEFQQFRLSPDVQSIFDSAAGQSFLAEDGVGDFEASRSALVASEVWKQHSGTQEETNRQLTWVGQILLLVLLIFVAYNYARRSRGEESSPS
ncbi:MAG: hypothetical protein AAF488_06200 [Planctomycetota bacterium]